MESLRGELEKQAHCGRAARLELPVGHQPSAENLLHYLALRSRDLRPLQDQLAGLGLSSLGRAEPHVLATIDAVLHNLYRISDKQQSASVPADAPNAIDSSVDLLERNTIRLLGDHPQDRRTHIMVTMPAEAATDYMTVHRLLTSGMDCMRINCAHDDPPAWSRMIKHLRDAGRASGRSCRHPDGPGRPETAHWCDGTVAGRLENKANT